MLRQDTLLLQHSFQGWAVGLVTRQTQRLTLPHILQKFLGKVVTKKRRKLPVLIAEKTTEFDGVVFGDQISLNTTRTVVPTFMVPDSMLTVGTLKLPSLLGFGEMREGKGNGVNDSFF